MKVWLTEKTRKGNSIMKRLFLQVNPIFQTRNGTFLFYMYCFSISGSFLKGESWVDRSWFIKGLAFLFVVPGDGWLVASWFSKKDGLTRPTFSRLNRVGMNQVIYWQLHGSMVFIYKSHQNEGSDYDLQYVYKCRASCGSTWIILSRILN